MENTTKTFEYGWVVIGKRNGLEIIDRSRIANAKELNADKLMVLLQIPLENIRIKPDTILYNFTKYRYGQDVYSFYGMYQYAHDDANRDGFVGIVFTVKNQVVKPEYLCRYLEACKKILPELKRKEGKEKDKNKLLYNNADIQARLDALTDSVNSIKSDAQYEDKEKMPFPVSETSQRVYYVPEKEGEAHLLDVLNVFHAGTLGYYSNILTPAKRDTEIEDSLVAHAIATYEEGEIRQKKGGNTRIIPHDTPSKPFVLPTIQLPALSSNIVIFIGAFSFLLLFIAILLFLQPFSNNQSPPKINLENVVATGEMVGVLKEVADYKEYDEKKHESVVGRLKDELADENAIQYYGGQKYQKNIEKVITELAKLKKEALSKQPIPPIVKDNHKKPDSDKKPKVKPNEPSVDEETAKMEAKKKKCKNYISEAENAIEKTYETPYTHDAIEKMAADCKDSCSDCDILGLKKLFYPEGYSAKNTAKVTITIRKNETRVLPEILLEEAGIGTDHPYQAYIIEQFHAKEIREGNIKKIKPDTYFVYYPNK